MRNFASAAVWVVAWIVLAWVAAARAEPVTPEQFGAVGDGAHDDTDAFRTAADAILAKGGGTFVLTAGKTYRVGRQERGTDEWPFAFYRPVSIFRVYNAGKTKKPDVRLAIEGHGAVVKLNDGLRIGSFENDTGAPRNSPRPDGDRKYRANPGHIFDITGCEAVEIRDLNIDGNCSRLVLGGQWGDTGRQCSATGISLSDCVRIRVDKVVSSHCGLDGIMLADWERTSSNHDWQISNSRFEYNARQGLSWCGGTNLTVTHCKFNHTGRDTFSSAPAAGLDIESESSPIRNGKFVACEFVNNRGCGMVADSGDSADVSFTKCLFWGTTSWSVWPRKPGFTFTECTFHGQAVNVYGSPDPDRATKFTSCRFEDVYDAAYDGGSYSSYSTPPRDGMLVGSVGENVLFDRCTLIGNRVGSGGFGREYGQPAIIRGCDITHKSSAPRYRGIQCVLTNVDISDTRFHEALEANPEGFSISLGETVAIGPGVVVDGPECRWGGRRTNGIVGAILSKPHVVATPTIIVPGGERITAYVRYAPGHPGDRLALHASGDGDGKGQDAKGQAWQYLDGRETQPAEGRTSATLSFAAPVAAGSYELRLVAGDGGQVAVSRPIVVSGVAVTVASTVVKTGEPITVQVKDAPPADGKVSSSKNWVGLYKAAAKDDDFRRTGRVAWQYLNGLQTAAADAATSATLTFPAPAEPGEYDFRFFLWQHGGRSLAKSQKLTVQAREKAPEKAVEKAPEKNPLKQ